MATENIPTEASAWWSRLPPTVAPPPSLSLIQFLLMAREGGIWIDCFPQGRNSTLKLAARSRCRAALACVRQHYRAGIGSAKTGQSGAIIFRP